MKKITDDELEILLSNINRNMKRYNDDISEIMKQSDRVELRYIQIRNLESVERKKVYAQFSAINKE